MKRAACLIALLLLAGCGLRAEPPMAQVLPASFVGMPPDAGRPPVDLAQYWTRFGDPTLDRLVAQARAQNFSIQAAQDRLEAAAATGSALSDSLLPNVTGLAEGAHQKLSAVGTSLPAASPGGYTGAASLDLTWALPLFGRLSGTQKQAAGLRDIAAAERREAQVAVIASVASVYITLRADQQRLAMLQDQLADANNIARLANIRQGAGMASGLETAQAQNHADAVALQIPPARLAIATDLTRLAVLEGAPAPDASLNTAAPIPPAPAGLPVFVPADLLRLRPQVMEAEARVEQAAGGLGIAVADLYPQFTLGGSLSILAGVDFLDPLTGTKFPDKVSFVEGGPGVTMPLLDWGSRYQQAKGAQATLAGAIEDYHEAVVEGAAAADTAIAEIAESRDELAAARRAQNSAGRAVTAAQILYGQGLTAFSDLLDADESRERAALAATSAAAAADTAQIDFYEAIGGGDVSAAPPPAAAAVQMAPGISFAPPAPEAPVPPGLAAAPGTQVGDALQR